MITNEVVNRAIEFILHHTGEELSVEDVAGHCHFSKFYFSRLFKAETGESVYSFIRRVRIEQSAFRLKVEHGRRITDIGLDYGYSPSNYSSAFRQHYHTTPVDFRRKIYQHSVTHPFFHRGENHLESFAQCNGKITVKELPDYYVVYERRIGDYHDLSRDWAGFLERYQEYIGPDTMMLERTYDDPSLTDAGCCLYDVCMTVDKSCPLENTYTVHGGTFAVYHFEGPAWGIYAAYQSIFNIWLPGVSYEIDERFGYDLYRKVNCDTMEMALDICIPVR